jgi:hypothetical protein
MAMLKIAKDLNMPFPRLTWAGLLIATLGWGFLLSYPLLAPSVLVSSGTSEIRDPARFILVFGENAVVTGLAIGVLGALERALHLLGRIAGGAGQMRPQLKPNLAPMSPAPVHAAPVATMSAQSHMLMPQRSSTEVVTRGALNGRDYILFRDGSVVVETLLGARRFPSITEAQEFIGAT